MKRGSCVILSQRAIIVFDTIIEIQWIYFNVDLYKNSIKYRLLSIQREIIAKFSSNRALLLEYYLKKLPNCNITCYQKQLCCWKWVLRGVSFILIQLFPFGGGGWTVFGSISYATRESDMCTFAKQSSQSQLAVNVRSHLYDTLWMKRV